MTEHETTSVETEGAAPETDVGGLRGWIFLTFLLVGPPVGLASTMIASGLTSYFQGSLRGGLGASIMALPVIMLFGAPFSYIFGGLQAGFTGFVAAMIYHYEDFKRIRLLPVAIAALVCASYVIVREYNLPRSQLTASVVMVIACIHLVPAVACWFITSRMVARRLRSRDVR